MHLRIMTNHSRPLTCAEAALMQSLKLFAWVIAWLVGALSCDAACGTGPLVNSGDVRSSWPSMAIYDI